MCPRDTSPEAWKVYLDLQRRMTPGEKLRRTLEYSTWIRQFAASGVRRRFPNADEREVFLRTAELVLGQELFRKVCDGVLARDG